MIRKVTDTEQVEKLFDGWEETMIWSCLQGVMGSIYADYSGKSEEPVDSFRPESAKAVLGDFVFLAGKPLEELLEYQPSAGKAEKAEAFQILVPRNEE